MEEKNTQDAFDQILSMDFHFHEREESCIPTPNIGKKILSIQENQFIFFSTKKMCRTKRPKKGCMENQNSFPLYGGFLQSCCTNAPLGHVCATQFLWKQKCFIPWFPFVDVSAAGLYVDNPYFYGIFLSQERKPISEPPLSDFHFHGRGHLVSSSVALRKQALSSSNFQHQKCN